MKTLSDRTIIETTARILAEDPEIPNARLLARLVAALGAEVATRFPVNRFERLVREPAMRAMRGRQITGTLAEPALRLREGYLPEGSEGAGEGEEGRRRGDGDGGQGAREGEAGARREIGEEADPGRGPSGAHPRAGDVDDALLAAFALGASSASEAEVIDAYRELGALRARVRRRLERAG